MTFKDLRDKVLYHTPVFKRIIYEKGDLPLLDFFQEIAGGKPTVSEVRRAELFTVVKDLVSKYINSKVGEKAIEQLRTRYQVSTTDHHGPITHPFFANSHFVQSFINEKYKHSCIFVFSVGGVSLNNSSFPRGFFFHDQNLEEQRLPFFSLRHRHHPVHGLQRFQGSVTDAILAGVARRRDLSEKTKENLKQFLRDVCLSSSLFSARDYSEQITLMNYNLWKKLPGQENTDLIYIEQEDVVANLLLRYHLGHDTIISRLLTDESWLLAFEKYFDGVIGAFSSKTKHGTMLFWAIQDGERKQLIRDGLALVSSDGEYRVSLESAALRSAIFKKEIMPSMALTFIVLSFYYGLSCGGGFLQVSYLTAMKESYRSMLKTVGADQYEIDGLAAIKTDYFCGEFVLSTLSDKIKRAPATPLDFLLYSDKNTFARLRNTAMKCTLNDAVDQMMPELYKIVCGADAGIKVPPIQYEPTLFV